MNERNEKKLAIIIPFFKITYLESLLIALARQTDKRFNLYIGNDNSPDDPHPIIQRFNDVLPISYRHYHDNLGHICPTLQWNRCLDMIEEEEWVWMLPDDDLISENCVEEFYKSLPEIDQNNINVATIPSKVIDADGMDRGTLIINPKVQSSYDFYFRQLKGDATGSSLGDNIFRRAVLVANGGFISFPRAWGSDHATVLNTAGQAGAYCLQNAWFGFRQSGINISSIRTDGTSKMSARIKFLDWLKQNENIFNKKPDQAFYQFFYWKGEHYFLHEWQESVLLYKLLYQLRYKSTGHKSPLFLLKLFLKKRFYRPVPA
jgi:Glycosyl transferase family 2